MKNVIPICFLIMLLWLPLGLRGTPPLPCQISVTGGNTTICRGQPLLLIAKVDHGLAELTGQRWESEGKLLTDPEKPFVKFDTGQAGVFLVRYFAWDEEGREARCEQEIKISNAPEIEIVENFPLFYRILFKKPKLLTRINSTENHIFQWFLEGEPISGETFPNIHPSVKGRYQIRVTNQEGCSAFSNEIIIE